MKRAVDVLQRLGPRALFEELDMGLPFYEVELG